MERTITSWKAAYYPSEIIRDPRTKTIACILFDEIICHFPVGGMACGGGHGISQEIIDTSESRILFEAGVLRVEEKVELSDVGWDYFHSDIDKYFDLQVTAMALEKFKKEGAIPFSDNSNFRTPASVLSELNFLRNAKFQGMAIAVSSIEMSLPPFRTLKDEEILKAREILSEQLVPFRMGMVRLAPTLRKFLSDGCAREDILNEARYLSDTLVMPALYELNRRAKLESGSFWKKIILKNSTVFPKFLLNFAQGNIVGNAMEALNIVANAGEDYINFNKAVNQIQSDGGLGFLLSLKKL